MKTILQPNKYNILRVIDALADIVTKEKGLLVSRNPENVPRKDFKIAKSFEDEPVESYGRYALSFSLHNELYQIVMSDNPFRDICFSKSWIPYGIMVEEPIFQHMKAIGRSTLWSNNLSNNDYEKVAKELLDTLIDSPYSCVEKEAPEKTLLYTKNSTLSKIWEEVRHAS